VLELAARAEASDIGRVILAQRRGVPLAALYGDLLAHVGFKTCLTGSVSRARLTVYLTRHTRS
jgi:hypothetical protein